MRKLAVFGAAFCAAVLVSVYGLPASAGLLCAAVLAAAGLLPALLRKKAAQRAAIACLGLAAGLVWVPVYETLALRPAEKLAGTEVTLEATLLEYPEATTAGCAALAMLSDGQTRAEAWLYLDADVLDLNLEAGSVLSVTGYVTTSAAAENETYQADGAFLLAYAGSSSVLQAEGTGLRTLPARTAHTVQARIREIFPSDVAGLLLALLTGERGDLSDSAVSSMQLAGVYHAVSISGMHVSILMSFLALLIRRRRPRALAGIPVLLVFLLLTGGAAGVRRAVIMQILLLLASLIQEEYDAPTALAAAAVLMLAANPWTVSDAGFQLSFLATAGILLFSGRIQTAVSGSRLFRALEMGLPAGRRARSPVLLAVSSSIAVSLGALVFTVPLMAYDYGTLSVISPLSSLVLLWSVTCCFALGLAAVLLSSVFLPLGKAAAWICAWPARYFLWGSGLLAKIPFASVSLTSPYITAWLAFAYLLLLALLCVRHLRIRPVPDGPAQTAQAPQNTGRLLPALCALVLTFSLSILLSAAAYTGRAFSFTAVDVGQGQCLVLSSGGVNLMIDCGGDEDPGDAAYQFLNGSGQLRVDALILTHFDSDHCNGVTDLLDRMPVTALYIPAVSDQDGNRETILAAAEAAGTAVYEVSSTMTLTFGTASLQIFPPLSDAGDNEACLSALFACGDFRALVTGDMPESIENRLLSVYAVPDVDLLVAGHHGSAASTGEALLAAAAPELVLISVGADNAYGHPAEEVLLRLEAAGAQIYRTDLNGTITVSGD